MKFPTNGQVQLVVKGQEFKSKIMIKKGPDKSVTMVLNFDSCFRKKIDEFNHLLAFLAVVKNEAAF